MGDGPLPRRGPEKDAHPLRGVRTRNYLILITKHHQANPNREILQSTLQKYECLANQRTVEKLFQIKETGQVNAVCDPGADPREEEESCRQRH